VTEPRAKDLAALVESNRFVGSEFLLWLWFESEVFETNLRPTGGPPCAIWIETQITLSTDADEARIKSAMPAATPESKQALRQGKLPKQARMRALIEEHEFSWVFKADALAVGSLKIPAELKAKDEPYEALYERMRITEKLEAVLEGLYADFTRLRLSSSWDATFVPLLKKWARGKPVDEGAYKAEKAKILEATRKKKSS
jgi:hypothetical protein